MLQAGILQPGLKKKSYPFTFMAPLFVAWYAVCCRLQCQNLVKFKISHTFIMFCTIQLYKQNNCNCTILQWCCEDVTLCWQILLINSLKTTSWGIYISIIWYIKVTLSILIILSNDCAIFCGKHLLGFK